MAWQSYKERSKENWGTSEDTQFTMEEVQYGCILRIADAVEKMAQRHTDLIQERDQYEKWYSNEAKSHKMTSNTLRVTKGHLTRVKNRIKQLEAQLAEKEIQAIQESLSERASQV